MYEEFNSIERETLEHEREEEQERQDEINMGVDEVNDKLNVNNIKI